MTLLELYSSLPTIEQVPSFYVPGYTESLKTYTGVRVIPDPSFIDGVSKVDLTYLKSVGFPCYFIPLMLHNNCYGYVLKGREKKTPRRHTKNVFPGQTEVTENDVVCLVEGFKDSYLLRKIGIHAIPMLTSEPCKELLTYLETYHCRLVFIPDNDQFRSNFIESFKKSISNFEIPYFIYKLDGVKDLGDFFLPELRDLALVQAKKIRKITRALSHAKI